MPVCLWVTTNYAEKLPLIADERICGDTFLKVERLDKNTFLVGDIWMYNSNCVFACSTFKQRYDWLKELLQTFTCHIEGVSIKLLHKSDYTGSIRGYEEHTEETIGKSGYFIEDDKSVKYTATRLNIPDCYEVGDGKYLRVPDIKTSVYLRSKGDTFVVKCVPYDDEYWDVAENIPEVE